VDDSKQKNFLQLKTRIQDSMTARVKADESPSPFISEHLLDGSSESDDNYSSSIIGGAGASPAPFGLSRAGKGGGRHIGMNPPSALRGGVTDKLSMQDTFEKSKSEDNRRP